MIASSTGVQPRWPQRGQPGFVFTVPRPSGFAYALPHALHSTVTTTASVSMSPQFPPPAEDCGYAQNLYPSKPGLRRLHRLPGRAHVVRDLPDEVLLARKRSLLAETGPELDSQRPGVEIAREVE